MEGDEQRSNGDQRLAVIFAQSSRIEHLVVVTSSRRTGA